MEHYNPPGGNKISSTMNFEDYEDMFTAEEWSVCHLASHCHESKTFDELCDELLRLSGTYDKNIDCELDPFSEKDAVSIPNQYVMKSSEYLFKGNLPIIPKRSSEEEIFDSQPLFQRERKVDIKNKRKYDTTYDDKLINPFNEVDRKDIVDMLYGGDCCEEYAVDCEQLSKKNQHEAIQVAVKKYNSMYEDDDKSVTSVITPNSPQDSSLEVDSSSEISELSSNSKCVHECVYEGNSLLGGSIKSHTNVCPVSHFRLQVLEVKNTSNSDINFTDKMLPTKYEIRDAKNLYLNEKIMHIIDKCVEKHSKSRTGKTAMKKQWLRFDNESEVLNGKKIDNEICTGYSIHRKVKMESMVNLNSSRQVKSNIIPEEQSVTTKYHAQLSVLEPETSVSETPIKNDTTSIPINKDINVRQSDSNSLVRKQNCKFLKLSSICNLKLKSVPFSEDRGMSTVGKTKQNNDKNLVSGYDFTSVGIQAEPYNRSNNNALEIILQSQESKVNEKEENVKISNETLKRKINTVPQISSSNLCKTKGTNYEKAMSKIYSSLKEINQIESSIAESVNNLTSNVSFNGQIQSDTDHYSLRKLKSRVISDEKSSSIESPLQQLRDLDKKCLKDPVSLRGEKHENVNDFDINNSNQPSILVNEPTSLTKFKNMPDKPEAKTTLKIIKLELANPADEIETTINVLTSPSSSFVLPDCSRKGKGDTSNIQNQDSNTTKVISLICKNDQMKNKSPRSYSLFSDEIKALDKERMSSNVYTKLPKASTLSEDLIVLSENNDKISDSHLIELDTQSEANNKCVHNEDHRPENFKTSYITGASSKSTLNLLYTENIERKFAASPRRRGAARLIPFTKSLRTGFLWNITQTATNGSPTTLLQDPPRGEPRIPIERNSYEKDIIVNAPNYPTKSKMYEMCTSKNNQERSTILTSNNALSEVEELETIRYRDSFEPSVSEVIKEPVTNVCFQTGNLTRKRTKLLEDPSIPFSKKTKMEAKKANDTLSTRGNTEDVTDISEVSTVICCNEDRVISYVDSNYLDKKETCENRLSDEANEYQIREEMKPQSVDTYCKNSSDKSLDNNSNCNTVLNIGDKPESILSTSSNLFDDKTIKTIVFAPERKIISPATNKINIVPFQEKSITGESRNIPRTYSRAARLSLTRKALEPPLESATSLKKPKVETVSPRKLIRTSPIKAYSRNERSENEINKPSSTKDIVSASVTRQSREGPHRSERCSAIRNQVIPGGLQQPFSEAAQDRTKIEAAGSLAKSSEIAAVRNAPRRLRRPTTPLLPSPAPRPVAGTPPSAGRTLRSRVQRPVPAPPI